MAVYTNVEQFIAESRRVANGLSNAMNAARKLHDEFIRIGGETRVSPWFFTLPPPGELRTDLPYGLADFTALMSAFKVLSAGDDNGVAGLAAQINAQWAVLDKIKG